MNTLLKCNIKNRRKNTKSKRDNISESKRSISTERMRRKITESKRSKITKSKRSKITESKRCKITETQQGKYILSNKAFTLIEVLVTVIIIGIISGITILSYHYVNNTNALKCAKQLSVILDKTRIESMGMVKDSIILRIVKEDSSYCAVTYRTEIDGGITKETEFDKVKIGSDSLSILYTNAGSEEDKKVTIENPLTIRFSKDSGSIKEAISEIKIVGRKTSTILLVKETGRNYLK